jgi:hypothetical protein
MNALDDLVLDRVLPLLYATEIKSHLNARRFLFVVVDKHFEAHDSPVKCTFARLYPHHKSIDFKEFKDVEENSPLRCLSGSVEYTELVHRLDKLRDVSIERIALIDASCPLMNKDKDKDNKKLVSQYAVTGQPGMVLLFHTTNEPSEYVDNGNLLSAIITFNTMIVPEFTSMTSVPVFEARPVVHLS